MKLALITILLVFELSISNTPKKVAQNILTEIKSSKVRKISDIERKDLMLVGLWNYSTSGGSYIDNINFDVHFIRKTRSPYYRNMSISTLIKTGDNKNLTREANCTNGNGIVELKDLLYKCNINLYGLGISNITEVIPTIKFKFYNDSKSYIEIAENQIDKSSFAETNIKNLIEQTKDIDYSIFYLDEIELNKTEFNLKGNISEYLTESKFINLNLSGTEFNSSLANESIKFTATGTIDAYLHGNMTEISDDQYILIYAGEDVDDHVVYPVSNFFIEVLGFGNYRKSTDGLARNQLYLTGDQYSLNALKQHIQFNTIIYYKRNLRNLQQDNKVIMANGTRVSNDQENDIVIYNITYYETEDLTIVRMIPPSNIQFSDNGEKYEKLSTNIQMTIPPDVDLLEEGSTTFERMDKIKPDINSSAFSIDFNVSQKIDVKKNNISIIKYHPYFNINATDEIPCTIKNVSTMYRIICKPKKDVFTEIVNMKIIIPESSNRKLRILQTGSNRTLLPPTDATGKIEYTYSDDGRRTFFRSSSGGLSGGAIAAIVVCTVAVVAATIIVLLFLNRIPAGPPRIKTPTDMNLANSTSNINH